MNDALSGPDRTELLHTQPIPVFLNRRLADIFGLEILDNVTILHLTLRLPLFSLFCFDVLNSGLP